MAHDGEGSAGPRGGEGGATLEERVRIGTSGWSYPKEGSWYGVFYPKRRDELRFYSTYFNTVEVNTTFYRLPRPETTRAWARITPPEFRFAVKAWQRFTHPGMFREATGIAAPVAREEFDLFRRSLDPLAEAGKLGALLLQFPPSFQHRPESLAVLEALLRQFREYPLAVELRHRSWSEAARLVTQLLEACGATWAVMDEPKFASSIRQEIAPVRGRLYLRFHGRNRETWWRHEEAWERYDYLYSAAELEPFARRLRELAADPGVAIYAFFNNHARGQAVANAVLLKAKLGLPVRDLPPPLKQTYPVLGTIESGLPLDTPHGAG